MANKDVYKYDVSRAFYHDPGITNELCHPKTFQSLTVKTERFRKKLLYHIAYVTTNNAVQLMAIIDVLDCSCCDALQYSSVLLNTGLYIFLFSALYVVCMYFVSLIHVAAKSNKPLLSWS